jgi:hypothetical protein
LSTTALCVATLAAPSVAGAQASVERGRQLHEWFLTCQLDAIWAVRSPAARPGGIMATREGLEERCRDFQVRYGPLRQLVAEGLSPPYEGDVQYTHVGVYQNFSGQVRVTWTFDARGEIVGLDFPQYLTATAGRGRRSGPRAETSLLPLAFVVGGFLFLVLIGLLLFVASKKRGRRGDPRWAQTARELGLSLEPCGSSMVGPLGHLGNGGASGYPSIAQRMMGRVGDVEVAIGVRSELCGDGVQCYWDYFTFVEAAIEPPLQAGIEVKRGDVSSAASASLGLTGDLQIGDPAFDWAFVVRTLDPEFARALLLTPSVHDALLSLFQRGWHPLLEDAWVRLERTGSEHATEALRVQLDVTVKLAQRIRAARAQLPLPALERALREAWGPVAVRHDLALDVHHGVLRGRFAGADVEVRVIPGNGRFATAFGVGFDRPLGVDLSLTRQGALAGVEKFLGMQDIQVGDPAFDSRFVVKGRPEQTVRAILTPDVRQLLVDVQGNASRFVVRDSHLVAEIDWVVTDPSQLEQALELVTRTAQSLTRASQALAGPYRA